MLLYFVAYFFGGLITVGVIGYVEGPPDKDQNHFVLAICLLWPLVLPLAAAFLGGAVYEKRKRKSK